VAVVIPSCLKGRRLSKKYNQDLLSHNLNRLARFGANISDAHSCFIFLPKLWLLNFSSYHFTVYQPLLATDHQKIPGNPADTLVLAGFHSLSNSVVIDAEISSEDGLIGWVAAQRKPLQVSSFERDSRTLGVYSEHQNLKSFLAIPIPLSYDLSGSSLRKSPHANGLYGAISCDSRKSYAFSKLQTKLIEDLAEQISYSLRIHEKSCSEVSQEVRWEEFEQKSVALISALGSDSVEALRLRIDNFDQLEKVQGLSRAVSAVASFYRLIQQALPPHYPVIQIMNGDIIFLTDNMMSSYYENKIRAIGSHLRDGSDALSFSCFRSGAGLGDSPVATLKKLLTATLESGGKLALLGLKEAGQGARIF